MTHFSFSATLRVLPLPAWFYRWGNLSLEKSSHWPRATQPMSDAAGIQKHLGSEALLSILSCLWRALAFVWHAWCLWDTSRRGKDETGLGSWGRRAGAGPGTQIQPQPALKEPTAHYTGSATSLAQDPTHSRHPGPNASKTTPGVRAKSAQDPPSHSKGQRLTIRTAPPWLIPVRGSLWRWFQATYPLCARSLWVYASWGLSKVESMEERRREGILPESHCLLPSHASPQLPLTAPKCRDFLQRPGPLFTPPAVSSIPLSPRNAGHILIATSLSILSLLYLGLMGLPCLSK